MKKAFEDNVSRAKPRLRLGGLGPVVTESEAPEPLPIEAVISAAASSGPPQAMLTAQVQSRAERARRPRKTPLAHFPEPTAREAATGRVRDEAVVVRKPVAKAEPPPERIPDVSTPEARRERLKERLKAVRENPRPEPLPPTSAEAGVLAVERIATLQAELTQMKALNLALTQDLEAARRQAERATEEARLRIDEARRLAEQMEGRVKLLTDLERELAALEGERDEALLSLQESRSALESSAQDAQGLKSEIAARDQSLADSLAEEERMAGELERAHEKVRGLERALETLTTERDTLARQVADLTQERAELLEARKALESVHRALSQAASR